MSENYALQQASARHGNKPLVADQACSRQCNLMCCDLCPLSNSRY